MANPWGTSWGTSWGNSWGQNGAVGVAPTIDINQVSPVGIVQGRTRQLSAVVDGDPEPTVTWASDDELIATVDVNTGLVTAVALGTCIITATATNSEGTDDDSVTVNVVAANPGSGGAKMSLSIGLGI